MSISPGTKEILKALEDAEKRRGKAEVEANKYKRVQAEKKIIKGRAATPPGERSDSPPTPLPPKPKAKRKKKIKKKFKKNQKRTKTRSQSPDDRIL